MSSAAATWKHNDPKKLPVHQLMQIFDRIDTDRSGSVSTKELRKQLSTDPELQHMLGLKVRHPTRGPRAALQPAGAARISERAERRKSPSFSRGRPSRFWDWMREAFHISASSRR